MPRTHRPVHLTSGGGRSLARQPLPAPPTEEEIVMAARLDSNIKELIKIAEDAGWNVALPADGSTKIKWTGPNGEGPVFTPCRTIGRGSDNVRTELVRAGLTAARSGGDKDDVIELDGPREELAAAAGAVDTDLRSQITPYLALEALAAFVALKEGEDDSQQWQDMALAAEAEQRRVEQQLSTADETIRSQQALLTSIKDALSLPSWEVLPRIAGLLGIKT